MFSALKLKAVWIYNISYMMRRETKILLYASNLWYFSDGLIGPLFAVFAEKVGGDILDISWAWAIYLIISGLAIIVVGNISDKVSKEALMIVGYALNAFLTFAYIFVSEPHQLFALQAAFGISVALATPTWDALYDKYSGKGNKDGFIWGIADGTPNIVLGFAAIVGGFIVSQYSFTALFLIMGFVQVLATIVQARVFYKR